MREINDEVKLWKEQNKPVAIATVVKANGSPLRPIGSKMAITPDQQIAGSVTGGCIEGAVYEEAQQVLSSGKPKMLHYGVASDQTPWDIGLSCGSSLDVFVESLQTPAWGEVLPSIQENFASKGMLVCATLLNGEKAGAKLLIWPDGRTQSSLGSAALDQAAVTAARTQMVTRESKTVALDAENEAFVDVFLPPARLVIIGGVHIAIPLVDLARQLGFLTIILDPRKTFANRERFPHADELIVDWPSDALAKLKPDRATFVAALSHDEKLDNPALAVALKSEAAYVGVLGTKRKIPERLEALKELGVNDEQLKRLHAPIGLNLGAIQPEEIALSVLAEIVAVHHGLDRNAGANPSK